MDGVNGTVRSEEVGSPISILRTSPLRTVTASTGDLCGVFPQNSPTSVCMPICFLVREQAKSLVAIQDLQKRMQHLEGAQSEVITAISEVHDCFSGNGLETEYSGHPVSPNDGTGLSPINPKHSISISPLRNRLSNSKSGLSVSLSPFAYKNGSWKNNFGKSLSPCDVEIQQKSQEKLIEGIQAKESAVDSDKQDSGLDSDCRDQGLESNLPQIEITPSLTKYSPHALVQNNPDELLELLDEIGQKSEILCQHLSSEEQQVQSPQLGAEMTKLHHEHLQLHRLLCDIKGERDHLNSKIENLETTTDELASKNKNLEDNFMTLLVEKHRFETKCGLYDASGRSNNSSSDSCGSSPMYRNPFSRSIHKVDTSVVSAVLKETNPLDLQKQVLTFLMENEVLRSKIDQIGQWFESKELEKECFERAARDEIRELMCENERLRIGLEEQKLESAALKSKVRMLERVLQSVTLENKELNLQLGESFLHRNPLCENTRFTNERFSTSTSSNGCARRISLPAQNKNEQDITISCAKAKLSPNTSSFIDVTIEDPESSGADLAFEPTFNFSQRMASTPMAVAKNHLKFSDMMKSASVRFSTTKAERSVLHRPVGKRLSFGAVKSKQGMAMPSFGEFSKNPVCSGEASNACDKHVRTFDHLGTRPLDMIEEKPCDPKTFPFYSILEKLKENSENKFSGRNQEQDLVDCMNENVVIGSSAVSGNPKQSSSGQKCNNSPSSVAQEGPKTQTKERRPGSGHSKNIHRRIQNILDRITSESEEAVV